MRDRKELIEILECCHEDDCGHCPACHTDGRLCNGATELSIPVPVFIFDDVLKLLKEQDAKTVLYKEKRPVIPVKALSGFCPKCSHTLLYGMNKHFCGNCGKELKWDD